MHKHGTWWVSVTLEGEANRRATETKGSAMDWGIAHLLTVVEENGDYEHIKNPRHYKTDEIIQTKLMQSLARKKRYSEGWKRAAKKLATFKRRQSTQRKDMHHKLSAKIADTYSLVAMEKLQISNMSRSAKGTIDVPGKNVAAK
ncbi:MAG: putative transposase, partial [Parvicella sp.]